MIAGNERGERAVLFGSRATGTNTVSSDVDIALFGDGLSLTDQARLAAELEKIPMAQSVDLLRYATIRDRALGPHILGKCLEWYARSVAPGYILSETRRRVASLIRPGQAKGAMAELPT